MIGVVQPSLSSGIQEGSQPTSYPQYLRKIGLVVSDNSGSGPDLSNMRIKFHVEGMDFDRPKTAIIRVYNLATNTQNTIKNEFQKVMLRAGYQNGAYGIIFKGTIKQIKTGRESAIDSFLEIRAADSDEAFNFSFIKQTLAAGATLKQQADAVAASMQKNGTITSSDTSALAATGGVLPRGKVLYGLAAAHLNDIADTGNCSWTIENGKLVFTSSTGYQSGEAVVLTSKTGMVGIPEATNNGIEVTALLNPNIKIGTRVQIDNASINQTQINSQGFPGYTDLTFIADTSNDGFYRALVVSHYGDSRGNDWYTAMTCLAIDASASAGSSVQAYG